MTSYSIQFYRFDALLKSAKSLEDIHRIRDAIGAADLPDDERQELDNRIQQAKLALSEIAVAGTSFRQQNVALVKRGDVLLMHPDPYGSLMKSLGDPNGHKDPQAVLLTHQGRHVGFVPAKDGLAARYFPLVHARGTMQAVVTAVVGGAEGKKTIGLRVVLPDLETGQEPPIPNQQEALNY